MKFGVSKKNDKQLFERVTRIKSSGKISEYPLGVSIIKDDLSSYFICSTFELSNFGNGISTPELLDIKQVLWDCSLARAYKSTLDAFIFLKNKYSEYVLNGDYESALDILIDMKSRCGWSIWLIEANFFCAQRVNGLEGNKKLLEEIYNSRVMSDIFDKVYFISFMISERNEDGCDISLLYKKWHSLIGKIEDETFSYYLGVLTDYYIFNDLDKSKSAINLFNACHGFSIYDTYELLLRFIIEYEEVFEVKDIKLCLRLLDGINDERLNRLAFKYKLVEELTPKNLEDYSNPVFFPQVFNMLVKLDADLDVKQGYTAQLFHSLQSLLSNEEDFNESLKFISQFSVNFKHIDEYYSLMEIPSIFLNISEVDVVRKLMTIYGSQLTYEDYLKHLSKRSLHDVDDCAIHAIHDLGKRQKLLDEDDFVDFSEYYNYTPYTKSHSAVLNFHSLIQIGKIAEAFKLFVDVYLINTNAKNIFKLGQYIENKKWAFFKGLGSFIDSAIIIKAYLSESYDDKQIFNLKACWRSFMNECNLVNPSNLELSHFNHNQNKYVFFLKEICTPEVLESDAVNFRNTQVIKIERIKVCEKLLSFNSTISLIEEKDALERDLAIADGLNEVETTGLTVDEDRFISVAKSTFKNDFDRYKSFLDLDLSGRSKLKYEENIGVESPLITKPLEEGDNILLKLIRDLGDMFLQNQEFGLDYYLSMRVRHGRLIGVARGPLERRKLITKYSDEDKKYLDNRYWIEHFANHLSFDERKKINLILCDFSEWFDTEIDNFRTKQVQVLSEDKPEGVFNITFTRSGLQLIKDTVNADTTMENFLYFIMDYFMHNIYHSSVAIKKWINTNLKRSINNRFLSLQSDINNIVSSCSVGNMIVSEITSARTEMNKILDDISTWFDISSDSQKAIRTYNFENIIDISVSRTTRVYQSFSPKLDLYSDEALAFHSSVLTSLVDAFSIVFSNAIIHGGKDDPVLTIKCYMVDNSQQGRKLNVVISNPANKETIDHDGIEKIRKDIVSNKLKTRQEGGSGFHKLAAMSMIDNHNDLKFGYIDGAFFVDMTFTFDLVETEE